MSGRIVRVIYFFTGENSFEIERAVETLANSFDGLIEKRDADTIDADALPDILSAQTLFSEKRLIIIKQLSENKAAWERFSELVDRVTDDTTVVLVETKPDKRTKVYKTIFAATQAKEFPVWGVRDQATAHEWVVSEAKRRGLMLTKQHAIQIVSRVGLDQWQLAHAIDKLALVDEVNSEVINELIDAQPDENVFGLLDAALRGDISGLQSSVVGLRQTTDAYQTMGLLTSQILQLAALAMTDKSSDQVARDIGAHPFVLSKLAPHASRMNRQRTRRVVADAVQADKLLKSTGHDPWLITEQLLIKIARQV